MCGRFTLKSSASALGDWFGGEPPLDLPPRYNIAPTQLVAIVRIEPEVGQRQWQLVRWGLIPAWAKDASIGARMINARAETVADKPTFRTAFRRRRCLVPADGYFEWRKTDQGKQPYYFRLSDERPFAMAGLWEVWDASGSGPRLESCTIITTDANELTRPIHERMPVILPPAAYDTWLAPEMPPAATLRDLLRPYDSAAMRVDPVGTHVNNPRHDDPQCVALLDGR